MHEILLTAVQVLHVAFILFIVVTPFTNNTYFLLLHVIMIPFLYLHWCTNNDTCMLTVVERYIQYQINGKIDDNECFTCRLIDPIYNVNKNYEQFNNGIYMSTLVLWLISVYKV